MTAKNSVICIGELLIDFFCTERDTSLTDGKIFSKEAGGAPANVAATITALGGKAAFVGKVGNDSFGDFLIQTLQDLYVDTSMVVKDEKDSTTMAFVSLTHDGERDFQFIRGADKNLSISELSEQPIMQSKIIHFGSATALLEGHLKDTYFNLMETGKTKDIFISFDPNFRSDLWKGNESEFIELAKFAVSKSDFVKISDEELKLITKEKDSYKGIEKIHQLGAGIVAVTKGKEGSLISNGENIALISSPKINAVDTTGAGDAFTGTVLYHFANFSHIKNVKLDFEFLKATTKKANIVAAQVCTELGSLSALSALKKE